MRMTGAQRREQLLDATKAIAVQDGFHAVSIEAVARRAGITRPIVYGHFEDLGGLLEALVERESIRALTQLPDRFDDLLGALTAYLEAVRADPDTWMLVLMPQEGAPRLLHERIAAGRAAVVARLAQPLDPSALPDPELTAHMLSAYADEGARLTLQGYDVERILRLTRWILDRLT
jgi:AcrR family transcriptional regulator